MTQDPKLVRMHHDEISSTCGSKIFQSFSSESPWPSSEGALFEHVLRGWVYGPVVAFSRPSQSLGQLDEAFVEAQVVTNRIFPALEPASKLNRHFST